MKKILFQGDSITDAGRDRDNIGSMGGGYPHLIASHMECTYPGEYEFVNMGISGNRVVDLMARWKCDCINHRPDVLSILIGVNDVWHELNCQNGVDTESYEMVLRMLIDDALKALPDLKIMLLEPFVMKGSATKDQWEVFDREVRMKREAVQRIAKDYNLILVKLDEMYKNAEKTTDTIVWTYDGVHPSRAGHELIKRFWIEEFEKNFR